MNQIILVRHGESATNAGLIPHGKTGDHRVPLTPMGETQALESGLLLPKDFLAQNGLVYSSPYLRARQTRDLLLKGAGYTTRDDELWVNYRVYEDPRLREVDHGYDDVAAQEEMRKEHGWFYYRFRGGESPADCYDRCCTFLESLARQVERKTYFNLLGERREPRVLIVTHGLTIRCFVMRFLHLSVEQFENLANPKNCDLIHINNARAMESIGQKPQIVSGQWGVTGLRFRDKTASGEDRQA